MLRRCVFIALLSLVIASKNKKKSERSKNTTKHYHEEVFLEWNYNDELQWPGLKCQEGGPRQSPIDIDPDSAIVDYRNEFIKHGDLALVGYNRVLMTGINNGLTIQFSTEGEFSIHPMLSGGPLARQYRLEQLHFHWHSEHAIDGHKFPMEIHFVHVRLDLSVKQALQERDGLAIISLFCILENNISEEDEERMAEILELVPRLSAAGSRISGALLDLKKLLNPSDNYYSYMGSLTSPECNEVVVWIIFETPISMTEKQYKKLTATTASSRNYRSLQPLRRHVVYTPAPRSVWKTPLLASAISDFFSDVTDFFRNVTRFVKKKMLRMKD